MAEKEPITDDGPSPPSSTVGAGVGETVSSAMGARVPVANDVGDADGAIVGDPIGDSVSTAAGADV